MPTLIGLKSAVRFCGLFEDGLSRRAIAVARPRTSRAVFLVMMDAMPMIQRYGAERNDGRVLREHGSRQSFPRSVLGITKSSFGHFKPFTGNVAYT